MATSNRVTNARAFSPFCKRNHATQYCGKAESSSRLGAERAFPSRAKPPDQSVPFSSAGTVE